MSPGDLRVIRKSLRADPAERVGCASASARHAPGAGKGQEHLAFSFLSRKGGKVQADRGGKACPERGSASQGDLLGESASSRHCWCRERPGRLAMGCYKFRETFVMAQE